MENPSHGVKAFTDSTWKRILAIMHYSDNLLICPMCGAQLIYTHKALSCEKGHSFDLAKEGYINLLQKKLPGDTKEMVIARRSFFEQGFYRPLLQALQTIITNNLPAADAFREQPLAILDAGCGEGYYLGNLHEYLTTQNYQTRCIGIDISKEAIRMAAKRYKEVFFIVANLKEQLALPDQSQHLLLNIFAPRNTAEFARVLAPAGLLIIVIPGPEHLLHLRSTLHLLNIEENKQQHVIEQFTPDFTLLTTSTIFYPLHLHTEEIAQVVTMTPNYWHLSDETRQIMQHLPEIRTAAQFICLLFGRKSLDMLV